MSNVIKLWEKRRGDYWTMAVKYLRLIGNSGFLFTIYLLFVFGSYYYGQFLQWLPETFPSVLFFTLVFTWLSTRGRVRTFMKQGDLIFLTPIEGKLGGYIRSSIKYSWMMETFWLSLSLLLLAPLFFDRINEAGSSLIVILILLSTLKLWNLATSFQEQRILDKTQYLNHTFMRFGLNAVAVYALFSHQSIWLIGAIGILFTIFYIGYYRKFARMYSLKWERLVEIENQTVMTFYRIANSFTDVPSLKSKVKFRRWLNPVYKMVGFNSDKVYHYIFARSFMRSNDYFGIFIRLTFIGGLFLSIVEIDWGRWFIAVLFAYMTALQIETLKNHYDTSQMIELYPVKTDNKFKGHQFWMAVLGTLQSVVFSIVAVISYGLMDGFIILILSLGVYVYQVQVRLLKKYETS
ncbi:ABC transporter permease [Salipaludibacillus daqingensis]|uniref:ABC transporter permease n=1 Tax=Salipaludibacillus daqingensis TaxID=3041001 RepID=UPI002476EF9F|nr:ABC transporter permease [Salipaludibacillus daqingensis]